MNKKNAKIPLETFVRRYKGYTTVQNNVLYNRNLSMNAKCLYTMIVGRIDFTEVPLTKKWLMDICMEGERAFNRAWDALKQNGFLIVDVYPAEHGHFRYVYEVTDDNTNWDGVYLRYHDSRGKITKTNLTKALLDHTPQNVPTGENVPDHTLQNYTGGNHTCGERSSGNNPSRNVGSNSKDSYTRTNNKNSINPSLQADSENAATAEEGTSEEELQDEVLTELMERKEIPAEYQQQPKKMETAIKALAGYDFRQRIPYKGANGAEDTQRQNLFNMAVPMLVELSLAKGQQKLGGALVTNAQFLRALNNACTMWDEGGLEEVLNQILDTYIEAAQTRTISNVQGYLKTVIWRSLTDFKVKQDSEVSYMIHNYNSQKKGA